MAGLLQPVAQEPASGPPTPHTQPTTNPTALSSPAPSSPPAILCPHCRRGASKCRSARLTPQPPTSGFKNTPVLSCCFCSNKHDPVYAALLSAPSTLPLPRTMNPSLTALARGQASPGLSNHSKHLMSLFHSLGHNYPFICTIPGPTSATPTTTGLSGHRTWHH